MQNKTQKAFRKKPKYYKVTQVGEYAIMQQMLPDTFVPVKDVSEYNTLAKALRFTADSSAFSNTSFDDTKAQIASTLIEQVLSDVEVEFDLGHVANVQKRAIEGETLAGVCFMVSNAMPNVVKIGYSANLDTRMKQLKNKYHSSCSVLALIKCDDSMLSLLETLYHWYFNPAHQFEEWFDRTPVVWYINATLKHLSITD